MTWKKFSIQPVLSEIKEENKSDSKQFISKLAELFGKLDKEKEVTKEEIIDINLPIRVEKPTNLSKQGKYEFLKIFR